ncbi:hypothetical protein ABTL91_19145, partial [Acinetobacter baumannii]
MLANRSSLPAAFRVNASHSLLSPCGSMRSTAKPCPSGSLSDVDNRMDGKPTSTASALSGERRPACNSSGSAGAIGMA